MNKYRVQFLLLLSLVFVGCGRDFLDTEPAQQVSNLQLAQNPSAMETLLDGVYLSFAKAQAGGTTNHDDFGIKGIQSAADLATNDQTMAVNHWFGAYYNFTGQLLTNSRTLIVWRTFYSQIFQLNNIINAINDAGITDNNRYLLGQALVLKAYSLDQLARFYTFSYIGHENDLSVPLPTGTELVGLPRVTNTELYAKIQEDIEQGITLLDGFNRGSNKAKIDQKTAKGLAADMYLWIGNYEKAAEYANAARQGFTLMDETSYTTTGFSQLTNNTEAVWGFAHNALTTSVYASFFSNWDSTNRGYAGLLGVYKQIDKRLYDAISDTDYRKKNFNGATAATYTFNEVSKEYPAYTNFKFKDPSFFEGHYIYFRASLFYYIEAEALARIGRVAEARQVLYDITSVRDVAYALSNNSGDALINEIILQKRIEMWAEGFAWWDQKRMNIPLDRNYTGTNHASFGRINQAVDADRWRFQIPQLEVNNNPSMTQNP
ncbi:MAG: RagB/SusD family nutrient uptake outer membrane protein [Cruoricaptor ignavus]|nr:RagB/SusD family nutrient uptake outer membrane protein [Cruoricaptor ignavus]